MHFPQNEGGGSAGSYPASSDAAIAHLEKLRNTGAQFLLVPHTALWWLEHYREFGEYLNQNFTRLIDQPDACILFDLRREPTHPEPEPPPPSAQQLPHPTPFRLNA